MGITINVPAEQDTPVKRWRWAHRAIEKMRLLYNFCGEWYLNGKTEAQYDKIPQRLKARIAYTPRLTRNQWEKFRAWHMMICAKLYEVANDSYQLPPCDSPTDPSIQAATDLKESAAQDATIGVDLDRDITES